MPEAAKRSSFVAWGEELPTIKLRDHLQKCLREATCQNKNIHFHNSHGHQTC